MAIIPTGTKFSGISAGVETVERGSRRKNAAGEIYTIADINETITTTPADVTGTVDTLAHYDSTGTMSEAVEVTVNAAGDITSTADIQAANLTSGAGTVSGKKLSINAAQATAPTSAGTAGTAGDIVMHGTAIYICTLSGAATNATWSSVNLTAV
jgi:hypothetical protein